MFIQNVLDAMDAEPFAVGAGKQHATVTSLRLTKPRFQHGECQFGDGCTALLSPLADDSHVTAGSKDEVLTFEPGHLGHAQPRLDSDQEEGVIAPARPVALIR